MGTIAHGEMSRVSSIREQAGASLQQARLALAPATPDTAKARSALAEARGAFVIVQLKALARFAEEIEDCLTDIDEARTPASAEALAAMRDAIDALHQFVERVARGELYQPLRLFPLYAGLCALRSQPSSEIDLYYPDLVIEVPADWLPAGDVEAPSATPTERRSRFQAGLLRFLRADATGVQQMQAALAGIGALTTTPAQRSFWVAAQALLDALQSAALEPAPALKRLCGRIDLELRQLCEASRRVSEPVMREMLYQLAHAVPATELVRNVQRAFRLEGSLDCEPLAAESQGATADNLQQLKSVVSNAQSAWERHAAGEPSALNELLELTAQLVEQSSASHALLRELSHAVHRSSELMAKQPGPSEADLAQDIVNGLILTELLLTDAALAQRCFEDIAAVVRRTAERCAGEPVKPAAALRPSLIGSAEHVRAAVAEMGKLLKAVEQAVETAFADPAKRAELTNLDSAFAQLCAVLVLLDEQPMADATQRCQALVHALSVQAAGDEAWSQAAERLAALAEQIEKIGHPAASPADRILDTRVDHSVISAATNVEASSVAQSEQSSVAQSELPNVPQPEQPSVAQSERPNIAQSEQPGALIPREVAMVEALAAEAPGAVSITLDLPPEAAETSAVPEPVGIGVEPVADVPAAVVSPVASAEVQSDAQNDDDAELREIFLEEAEEVLATIDAALRALRQDPAQRAPLTDIRRSFHTLKGSSRMAGLPAFGDTAWCAEKLLNGWMENQRETSEALLEFIGQAAAVLTSWVMQLRGGAVTVDASIVQAAAEMLLSGGAVRAPAKSPPEAAIAASAVPVATSNSTTISIGNIVLSLELYQIFIAEAQRHAATLSEHAALLEQERAAGVSEAFVRAAHTLGGIAATAQMQALSELGYALEGLLLRLGSSGKSPSTELTDLICRAASAAASMVRTIAQKNVPFADESLTRAVQSALTEVPPDDPGADDAREDDSDRAGSRDSAAPAHVVPIAPEREVTAMRDAPRALPLIMGEPAAELRDSIAAFRYVEAVSAIRDSAYLVPAVPGEVPTELHDAITVMRDDTPSAIGDESQAVAAIVVEGPARLGAPDTMMGDDAVTLIGAEPHVVPATLAEPSPQLDNSVTLIRDDALTVIRDEPHALAAILGEPAPELGNAVTMIRDDAPTVIRDEPYAARALLGESAADERNAITMIHDHAVTLIRDQPHAASMVHGESAAELTNSVTVIRDGVDEQLSALLRTQTHLLPLTATIASPLGEQTRTLTTSVLPTVTAEQPLPSDRRKGRVADDIDHELLPVFLEEAQALAPEAAQCLQQLRANAHDVEATRSLKRILHTLKGSARMAGAMIAGELAHGMETRVESAEANDALAGSLDELQGAFDRLGVLLDELRQSDRPAPAQTVKAETPEKAAPVAARAVLRVRADVVDRLVNQAGEVTVARSRIEGEVRTLRNALVDLTDNVLRLRMQLRDIEIQAEAQLQSSVSAHAEQMFDPLEFDRFTRFQELTRGMAESVNDVATVQQALVKALDQSESALLNQRRLSRELQDGLMAVRMVPFSSLAERLHRTVRQSAKDLGKRVSLHISGAQIELDRSVLERMTAPLEHLLRNAITHGIEDASRRTQLGKSAAGEIQIELRHDGNEAHIRVSDDGGGLDLDAIRNRALQKRVIEESAQWSERQLAELIFMPGFSTASEVTLAAGRGVGMDVVKNEVSALGGRIDLDFERDRGTRFVMHLPLALGVKRSLLVEVGTRIYALPVQMIEQVMTFKLDVLEHLYQTRVAEWQGRRYPFHYLPDLLNVTVEQQPGRRSASVLMLRSGTERVALHVDRIVGIQELVTKRLGTQLEAITGVNGAAVLGTGQVVLLINPVQFVVRATSRAEQIASPAQAMTGRRKQPVIMVVDDSLTVRRVTSRLLIRAGYQVVTAKDGIDAVNQLTGMTPDIMLVDIEMPRMDGFELTKQVRATSTLAGIPIIMVTSRDADKHRRHAFELGVNAFMGKPYQEQELLEYIARFLQPSERARAA